MIHSGNETIKKALRTSIIGNNVYNKRNLLQIAYRKKPGAIRGHRKREMR